MPINRSEFSQLHFTQTGNSCVLASYGVCAYPFVSKDIEDFFQGYCEHFNLNDPNESFEKQYNKHFHRYTIQQGLSGYSLTHLYHSPSKNTYPARC